MVQLIVAATVVYWRLGAAFSLTENLLSDKQIPLDEINERERYVVALYK